MLLSLDPDQDINFLKWEAALQTKDQKFPHASAQKLKEILLDDQIQPQEFIAQFNKVIASTESLGWKTFVSLTDIKDRFFDQVSTVSWAQIFIIVSIFICLFALNKKFNLKTPTKKVSRITSNILERMVALFGYFVPLVVIYSSYVITLLPSYPYLNLIVPNFMRTAIKIYMQYPMYINFGYFFGIVFLCLQFKLPRPRFIRFHMIRGIMLLAFQGVPDLIFQLLQSSDSITPHQRVTTALCLFVINLFWILPCLYQAITHTYPRSSFIRDAIEIHVGRDDNEDFKWWDRT
jgi:hypothetical protein